MNVLDHGSLLVAAHDHHTDTYTSRTLVYSCDEGLSWSSFTFTNQPVSIYGVITEPGKTTTVIRSVSHVYTLVSMTRAMARLILHTLYSLSNA